MQQGSVITLSRCRDALKEMAAVAIVARSQKCLSMLD